MSAGSPSPLLAETGKYSEKLKVDASMSLSAIWGFFALSHLFTSTIVSGPSFSAINLSPGPIGDVASTTKQTMSISDNVDTAFVFNRSPSVVRGLWMPGVSTNTSCASDRWRTPRILCRVVWGLLDVIAIFSPQILFTRDDFPTLGLPNTVMKADLYAPDFLESSICEVIR